MRVGLGFNGASAGVSDGVRAEGPCGVNIAAAGVRGWYEIANSTADLIVGLLLWPLMALEVTQPGRCDLPASFGVPAACTQAAGGPLATEVPELKQVVLDPIPGHSLADSAFGFRFVCGPAGRVSTTFWAPAVLSDFALADAGVSTAVSGGGAGRQWVGGTWRGHTSYWSSIDTWSLEDFKLKERSFVKYSLYILIWLQGAIFYFVQCVIKTWDIYFSY